MNDGTRRFAMLTILVLVVSGCNAAQASGVAPNQAAVPTGSAPQSPSAPGTSAARVFPISRTVAEIARLEAAVAAKPSDGDAQRDLGFALLQRVRETADPSLYAPAAAAFDAARAITPDDAQVLVGIGGLELGKHQFADALATGRAAVELSPNLPSARAVVVDALVELGRYDEADAAAGEMLATGSNLSTLARISYLAELHGKLDVALTAMRMATKTPGLAPENVAFVDALLGNLLVYTGDSTGATDAYQAALALVPAHAPSLAGEGRLAVASGDLDTAIARFQRAADILPLPEYVLALADAQSAAGLKEAATRNEKLARAEIQLFQASGVVVDVDLALFEADHGDPAQALRYAEVGYRATPTVRAADALGWALHRLGRDVEARRRSDEALRLGSRDPLLRYHGGAIAAALGDVKTARADLTLALSTDPGFSATGAAEARRIIGALPH
ncbi:MAG: tetratricopeptide repeat protein [Chloroflexota bacterium]